MLDPQVIVNLLSKLRVGMDLGRGLTCNVHFGTSFPRSAESVSVHLEKSLDKRSRGAARTTLAVRPAFGDNVDYTADINLDLQAIEMLVASVPVNCEPEPSSGPARWQ